MAKYGVIITAAGRSERFEGKDKKIFAKIDDRPLFLRAAELFVNREDVCQTILAIAPEDSDTIKNKYGANLGFMGIGTAVGGETRPETVANALKELSDDVEYIAIHDAARICTTQAMIDAVFEESTKSGAAILASPITGTIKRATSENVIENTVSREALFEAQTPQVFRRDILEAAYKELAELTTTTDDAQVVELTGHSVTMVASDPSNLKITYQNDLAIAAAIMKSRPKPKAKRFGAFEEAQW